MNDNEKKPGAIPGSKFIIIPDHKPLHAMRAANFTRTAGPLPVTLLPIAVIAGLVKQPEPNALTVLEVPDVTGQGQKVRLTPANYQMRYEDILTQTGRTVEGRVQMKIDDAPAPKPIDPVKVEEPAPTEVVIEDEVVTESDMVTETDVVTEIVEDIESEIIPPAEDEAPTEDVEVVEEIVDTQVNDNQQYSKKNKKNRNK